MEKDIGAEIEDDVAEARRVLTIESIALRSLSEGLDSRFSEAVTMLYSCSGRVILTGMGKSGLVARKIAATFASTGTPAHFVHPAEANHGDLGMIAEGDVVLMLSGSGETRELNGIIYYVHRFGIPTIALTQKKESQLAKAASICILLSDLPDACPLNLAPMTSTTAMLALGDALAAALMRRRGFTAERFRNYHPGGSLGAVLADVKDVMHKGPVLPILVSGSTVQEAILLMTETTFGCVGVVEQGRLIGIFTDGDLRRCLTPDILTKSIDKVMSRNPKKITENSLIADVARTMSVNQIPSIFIVGENDAPVGIVHVRDLLRIGVI